MQPAATPGSEALSDWIMSRNWPDYTATFWRSNSKPQIRTTSCPSLELSINDYHSSSTIRHSTALWYSKTNFDLMKTLMQSAQIYKTHHSNRICIHLNELSTLWLLIIKFQNIIHIKRTFFSVFDNVIESQCLSTEKLFFTESVFI